MASAPQCTASTHRSAVVRGTHEFHIVGYSERRQLHLGPRLHLRCSRSPHIHHPGAAHQNHYQGCHRHGQPSDRRPRGPPAVWRSDAAHRFCRRIFAGMSWKLSLPDAFRGHEERYVTDDDRLTIICTVDILQEDTQTAAETRKCLVSVVPAPTIPRDFQQLLLLLEKYPKLSDVTFLVEATEFRAHRLVLAMRSPVFATELFGDAKESTTSRIRIDDIDASTFRAMIRFIYTDELPMKPINHVESRSPLNNNFKEEYMSLARKLLVAADRYDLERLRLMCENILSECINVATVMKTLLLVRGRQRCYQLQDSCIKYIPSDPDVYNAVRTTKEYEELKETCSSFIIEVGGYDWKINVYPSGYDVEEHISVYLCLCTDPGTATVKSSNRFRIDDPNGKSPSMSHYVGHDGSLTIHCDLDVHKEACTTSTSTTIAKSMIVVPPSNIAWHLEQLMVSGQWSNVTFMVEESKIHAHWLIIAMRSPVLFETVAVETSNWVIRIDDMKAAVLRAVLHFVYTDELLPVDDAVAAEEGPAAACRFRLERMRAMCENLLAHLITKDNVLSMLELAWRHQCEDLKLYCIEFTSLAMK
uniref:Speckle-type POZ protein-like protein n=1 Tax=Aegilops tauschii TaxID=37682 RepID=R7WAW9_AEGTA